MKRTVLCGLSALLFCYAPVNAAERDVDTQLQEMFNNERAMLVTDRNNVNNAGANICFTFNRYGSFNLQFCTTTATTMGIPQADFVLTRIVAVSHEGTSGGVDYCTLTLLDENLDAITEMPAMRVNVITTQQKLWQQSFTPTTPFILTAGSPIYIGVTAAGADTCFAAGIQPQLRVTIYGYPVRTNK